MNIVVSITNDSSKANLEIGDIFKFQVFIDEKIGSSADGWEVVAPKSVSWIPAGKVMISTTSLRLIPSDGNTTKIEMEAMVFESGALQIGPFILKNQVIKSEIEVPVTTISQIGVTIGAKPPQEPPWLQAPVSIGGWDWIRVGGFLFLLLLILIFSGRFFWIQYKKKKERKYTPAEIALLKIEGLQKYLKSERPLSLAEWKNFSFSLAEILRKYCDASFLVDSGDMTDRELLADLSQRSLSAPHVYLLATVLATITEVRYGRKELNASLIPGILLDARKFIESSEIKGNK